MPGLHATYTTVTLAAELALRSRRMTEARVLQREVLSQAV